MDQAVAWVLRLQGETLSVEDGLAFDAWLEESLSNAQAYAKVLATLEAMDGAESEIQDGLRRAQQADAKRLAGRKWAMGAGFSAMAAAAVLAVVVLPQGALIAQTSD